MFETMLLLMNKQYKSTLQHSADLLRLDGLRLFNGGSQGLHHLIVLKAVHYVLENVAIADKAKGSEDDEDGDIRSDVGDGCLHNLAS